ncbi:ATP-dependent chaperone ClpB, partial [Mycobacterium tuberculosis]
AAALGPRVLGPPAAVPAVSAAVRRRRAGVSAPPRPPGAFLFLGPPGVGPPELAPALAAFLFAAARALVRLALRASGAPPPVARLLGAPPGSVGSAAG